MLDWNNNWLIDWLILTAFKAVSGYLCLEVRKWRSLYVHIYIFILFPEGIFFTRSNRIRLVPKHIYLTLGWTIYLTLGWPIYLTLGWPIYLTLGWPIYLTQTDSTTPDKNGPESNGNNGVLYIPQISRTRTSPLETVSCHSIYPTPPLGQDVTQGQFLSWV